MTHDNGDGHDNKNGCGDKDIGAPHRAAAPPPYDENKLSEQLKTALDQLDQATAGIGRIIIQNEDARSELLLRRLLREGKSFKSDDFGGR